MNLSDEKYSADDMDGSNQVSVPIMMSGWRLSSRTSRSGFLFFMERKFMVRWSGLKAPAEPSCRVPTYKVYFFQIHPRWRFFTNIFI